MNKDCFNCGTSFDGLSDGDLKKCMKGDRQSVTCPKCGATSWSDATAKMGIDDWVTSLKSAMTKMATKWC